MEGKASVYSEPVGGANEPNENGESQVLDEGEGRAAVNQSGPPEQPWGGTAG